MQPNIQHTPPSADRGSRPASFAPADSHAALWAVVSDRTIVVQMPNVRQELLLVDHALSRCGTAGMPAGYPAGGLTLQRSTNHPTAAAIQQMDSQLEGLTRHRAQLLQWINRFEQVCLTIPLWRDRLIIRSSYGEGMRDSEIAAQMHLSRHYVNRLKQQALKQLSDQARDTAFS